jgi:hypothetical protein
MILKATPIGILLIFFVLSIFFSCKQPTSELKETVKTENTLKSVSIWNDTVSIDPSKLLAAFIRINAAIDSIGYPDAGYELWQMKSDSINRFLVEGFWPNQNAYDAIHDHEIYKTAMKNEEQNWEGLEMAWYNRFAKVLIE